METIIMDSEVFRTLNERLTTIENLIRNIQPTGQTEPTEKMLLTSTEVCDLLRICKRTLQRWRDNHLITYVISEGKCLYEYREIKRILKEGIVNAGISIDDLLRKEWGRI